MARYLICYDVSDDRRRGRLRTMLLSYGDAVEESVFEVVCSPHKMQRLRAQILRLIDVRCDVVRLYGLCRHCEQTIDVISGPPLARRPAVHIL